MGFQWRQKTKKALVAHLYLGNNDSVLEIFLGAGTGGEDARTKRWTDMGVESTLGPNLHNFAWSVLAKRLWKYESEIRVSKEESIVIHSDIC